MIRSHRLINPLIEGMTSDTLGRCEESLAYIAETVITLQTQEASPLAYQGLQGMIDCIQQALSYEIERLNKDALSNATGAELNLAPPSKH